MSTGEKRLGNGCALTTFYPGLRSRGLVCGNDGSLDLIRRRLSDTGHGFASQRIDGRQGSTSTDDTRSSVQHFVLHVVFPGPQFDFNGSELSDVQQI